MGVEFDEGNMERRDFKPEGTSGFTGWLVKKGIAKNVNSANKLEVIVSVVFILISIYLVLR